MRGVAFSRKTGLRQRVKRIGQRPRMSGGKPLMSEPALCGARRTGRDRPDGDEKHHQTCASALRRRLGWRGHRASKHLCLRSKGTIIRQEINDLARSWRWCLCDAIRIEAIRRVEPWPPDPLNMPARRWQYVQQRKLSNLWRARTNQPPNH